MTLHRPTLAKITALAALVCSIMGATLAAAQTSTGLRADGTLLVDGEPFFPVGMYHTSWIDERYGAVQIADLEDIAAAGMNTIHPNLRATHFDFLNRADELGVRVISGFDWDNVSSIVPALKNYPAIIGWLVADDFNTPINNPEYSPTDVTQRSALVHSLDPAHLTIGSGTGFAGAQLAGYLGTMDITGIQAYPIEGGTVGHDDELQQNVDYFEHAWNVIGSTGQPVIGTVQAFNWDPLPSGGRYPTTSESRNLLYGALINGVKGILWYAYYFEAGTTMPSEAPALWAELALQVIELDYLRDQLIDGTRTLLDTGNSRVHGARWQLDGETVVALLNVDRLATHAVDVTVPGASGAGSHPFGHRTPPTFSLNGETLSATLGPEEVGVYAVTATPGSTTTTTLAAGCSPAPRVSCLTGERGGLEIKTKTDASRDKLEWKLARVDAFTHAALADPAGTTSYSVCFYDETAGAASLVGSLTVSPGGDWRDRNPKGWKYKDSSGVEDGVTQIQLTPSDTNGRARLKLKARGSTGGWPAPVDGTRYFVQDGSVTVQLVNTDTATCWTSELAAPAARNVPDQFKDKTP